MKTYKIVSGFHENSGMVIWELFAPNSKSLCQSCHSLPCAASSNLDKTVHDKKTMDVARLRKQATRNEK